MSSFPSGPTSPLSWSLRSVPLSRVSLAYYPLPDTPSYGPTVPLSHYSTPLSHGGGEEGAVMNMDRRFVCRTRGISERSLRRELQEEPIPIKIRVKWVESISIARVLIQQRDLRDREWGV